MECVITLLKEIIIKTAGTLNDLYTVLCVTTGFIRMPEVEIQGLFKNFQGHVLEIKLLLLESFVYAFCTLLIIHVMKLTTSNYIGRITKYKILICFSSYPIKVL